MSAQPRIPNPETRFPALYAIVDAEVAARFGWTVTDLAGAFIDGGARLIQLRAKRASGRDFLRWAGEVVGRGRSAGARIIINDRVDVAVMATADGVHVGQDDLPPRRTRDWLGASALIGLSTYTDNQIAEGVTEPISYLAVGPVFASGTKDTGYPAGGLDLVRRAALVLADYATETHTTRLPLVAIGGITLDSAPDVIGAGADSVAIVSDLLSTGDPAGRARAFLSQLASR
ncbi:MAG: thiamine phosphate synthase [Acidobacteria bacterium]|nr:thiamine phosphate synthase [Acidobacteriota bacterium]